MMQDPAKLSRLDGKVALLTGASKGIGAAMARGLAAFGARVVLSSRKQEAVDALVVFTREQCGGIYMVDGCYSTI